MSATAASSWGNLIGGVFKKKDRYAEVKKDREEAQAKREQNAIKEIEDKMPDLSRSDMAMHRLKGKHKFKRISNDWSDKHNANILKQKCATCGYENTVVNKNVGVSTGYIGGAGIVGSGTSQIFSSTGTYVPSATYSNPITSSVAGAGGAGGHKGGGGGAGGQILMRSMNTPTVKNNAKLTFDDYDET
jgi:hypothetical protein